MQITQLTVEGRAALAEGDGQRALELMSRKHERLLGVLLEDSWAVGTSLVELAEALHVVGRQKEARKAVDHALVIFKRLDRRDKWREERESVLIEICRRQGHSFVIEDFLRDRISGGSGPLKRAVDQDQLAMMFCRRGQYDKALPLLMDSKDVFPSLVVSSATRTLVGKRASRKQILPVAKRLANRPQAIGRHCAVTEEIPAS